MIANRVQQRRACRWRRGCDSRQPDLRPLQQYIFWYVEMQILVAYNKPQSAINNKEISIIARRNHMYGSLSCLACDCMLYPQAYASYSLLRSFPTNLCRRQRYSRQNTHEICALWIVPMSSSRSAAPSRRARATWSARLSHCVGLAEWGSRKSHSSSATGTRIIIDISSGWTPTRRWPCRTALWMQRECSASQPSTELCKS